MEKNKFDKQLENLSKISDVISENTELYKYIKQINELMNLNEAKKKKQSKYEFTIEKHKEDNINRPFLSVILRTQGNREEGLREALLCLRAQTNQDFEVILIGHKASTVGKKIISEIISEQPDNLKKKITYIILDEGTRTVPINLGVSCATGKYISIYDDDDLLFDNWVEKFYETAQKKDGKIIHAYVLAQKWKMFSLDEKNGSEKYYMALEAPTNQFCVNFDFLTQLVINRCPLMSLAFPSYLFQEMGIMFDESLNVTEDWEYFTRVVSITGVEDVGEVTSIYRLWVNAETSATLHTQDTWLDTYSKIQSDMNERQLLVPRGYTQHIIGLINRCSNADKNMPLGFPKIQGILYYANDWRFSDEKMVLTKNNVYAPDIDMDFKLPTEGECYQYFRIDPSEFGGYILENAKIFMYTDEGGEIEIYINECDHNGLYFEGAIYFMHYDPQIAWCYMGNERIVSVKFLGNTNMEIPEDVITKEIKRESIQGKALGKCKKIIKKYLIDK